MTDNLNQYIDLIYENKHEQIPVEQMQIIGKALQRVGSGRRIRGKEIFSLLLMKARIEALCTLDMHNGSAKAVKNSARKRSRHD